MRSSVSRRGAAGATFDHVAAEAGVSRGLLHYYFGSKERLLVEVMRHDAELRVRRLEEGLAGAGSVDAIVDVLVSSLAEFLQEERDTGQFALLYEMFSAGRRNPEIRREMGDMYRALRAHVAGALAEKEREGVVALRGEPEALASVLFALADGIALQ